MSEVRYTNSELEKIGNLTTCGNALMDITGELKEKIQDNEKDISTLCRYVVKENKKIKEEFDDKHKKLIASYDALIDETSGEIRNIDSRTLVNTILILIALIMSFILCIHAKIVDVKIKDISTLSPASTTEYTSLNPTCPMCHSDSIVLKHLTEDYYIECENCGLHTGYYGNEATLRYDWNSMVDSILTREVE